MLCECFVLSSAVIARICLTTTVTSTLSEPVAASAVGIVREDTKDTHPRTFILTVTMAEEGPAVVSVNVN